MPQKKKKERKKERKVQLSKTEQEEMENLNRPITSTEIFQKTKAQDQTASQLNSTKNLEKN